RWWYRLFALQWRRELSFAEWSSTSSSRRSVGSASMEPRTFVRGMEASVPAQLPAGDASMEPRTFVRGMDRDDQEGAEEAPCFNGAANFRSRNGCPRGGTGEKNFGFNGAANFRSRNAWIGRSSSATSPRFNGAA